MLTREVWKGGLSPAINTGFPNVRVGNFALCSFAPVALSLLSLFTKRVTEANHSHYSFCKEWRERMLSLSKEWWERFALYERVILSFEVWLASNLFFSPSFSHFYAQKKEQIAVKDDIHQWLVYNYALYKNTTILSKFYFKKSVNFLRRLWQLLKKSRPATYPPGPAVPRPPICF